MKTTTTIIIFLSLFYWHVALGEGTIQKCVDANGAVTFTDRCASNQHATDTGLQIDDRTAEQKAQDNAKIQQELDELDKQSKMIPTATAVPVAQSNPSTTETPTSTADEDNDSYDCPSTSRNCFGYNNPNLTPAEKLIILNRVKAVQLPAARIKRR